MRGRPATNSPARSRDNRYILGKITLSTPWITPVGLLHIRDCHVDHAATFVLQHDRVAVIGGIQYAATQRGHRIGTAIIVDHPLDRHRHGIGAHHVAGQDPGQLILRLTPVLQDTQGNAEQFRRAARTRHVKAPAVARLDLRQQPLDLLTLRHVAPFPSPWT